MTELDEAINYWRGLRPSTGEERALSTEVNALAGVYAQMIFEQRKSLPLNTLDTATLALLEKWRQRSA